MTKFELKLIYLISVIKLFYKILMKIVLYVTPENYTVCYILNEELNIIKLRTIIC